ncbi:response regulator transcription factor [Lysinibacillus fusiformis]|uniref:response regulator transcription factor n=2 Tax=Lysinibacillus fusiformis TaxID=28031 RepID=UPI000881D231|nr:response regulator transcription factor [Lysinibacillus fusiformis]SCX40766.1 DNA-binding response regulator, OmpR family, contains REC and winged-helix (wHTH) domain [Lysinibacillus fusiformis]SDB09829.1 DNA-binding response regulator, OmpR family, contains REC and winged-helix (wHTH) domain [Lysinibacillus fusiformis]SFH85960.1 DNA-binding response regulator, OmpR family, contains REC and winged-helix (wHTH) domain [Lysinibacillus fusiformis]SFS30929.1 DNA-binding response regulator, OmpR 
MNSMLDGKGQILNMNLQDVAILLVDDESAILDMLQMVLTKEGFRQIDRASTAQEALNACNKKPYDMILLDVMLPDRSGFDICPFIRETTDAPILFITAKNSDLEKLTGFAMGGDDYITKPFNPLEIVARMKAQLRRVKLYEEERPLHLSSNMFIYDFGRFQVNERAGELMVDGQVISCPAQVYQLLLFFCKHPNQIFTKSQLYEAVWGDHSFGDDNTVTVHIGRIRERIEKDPKDPELLLTIRGLGYKLIQKEGMV